MAPQSRYVCARAGALRFAFAIDDVQEVLAPRAVTRLFHAPPSLLGVIGLRGEILPVLDLAALVGAPEDDNGAVDERFVVLRTAVGERTRASFAMRVTSLDPLRDAGSAVVEPLPPGVPELAARLSRGIVTQPSPALLVLDPAKVIALDELAALR